MFSNWIIGRCFTQIFSAYIFSRALQMMVENMNLNNRCFMKWPLVKSQLGKTLWDCQEENCDVLLPELAMIMCCICQANSIQGPISDQISVYITTICYQNGERCILFFLLRLSCFPSTVASLQMKSAQHWLSVRWNPLGRRQKGVQSYQCPSTNYPTWFVTEIKVLYIMLGSKVIFFINK